MFLSHRFTATSMVAAAACAVACTSKTPDPGPAGGPAAGPSDTHCAGKPPQPTNLVICKIPPAATNAGTAASDYGATLFGTEGDDDDCKYHVKWSATPLRENTEVTFTVIATKLAEQQPLTGSPVRLEVVLGDTHPAPNTDQRSSESSAGTYAVGPVVFDKPGRWTVRFHFHEECFDTTEDSAHGHAAFYVDVP